MKIDFWKEREKAVYYNDHPDEMPENPEEQILSVVFLYIDDLLCAAQAAGLELDFTWATLHNLPEIYRQWLQAETQCESVPEKRFSPVKSFGLYMMMFMVQYLDGKPVLIPDAEIEQRYTGRMQQAYESVTTLFGRAKFAVEFPDDEESELFGGQLDPLEMAWYTANGRKILHGEMPEIDFYLWICLFRAGFSVDLEQYGFTTGEISKTAPEESAESRSAVYFPS